MSVSTYGKRGAVPAELASRAAKHWFGESGRFQHDVTSAPRMSSDGGGYRFTGTRIHSTESGESAMIYIDSPGIWHIEFNDTSGGKITANLDGSYTFTNYYTDPVQF